MAGGAKHDPGKGAGKDPHGATPKGEPDGLRAPADLKPWADKALPPSERLDAYKSFIRSQVEATLAAVDALDGDARRQLEIRDAPETQRMMSEARWVQSVTAEEFCRRMDPWTPLERAQEMVDSYSFNKTTGVSTFTVPADVTDVEAMKALNEYFRKHHPSFDSDAVYTQNLEWFEKLPQEFRDHCQERDYSQARQITITGVVDGTTEKDRTTQEGILKKRSLVFSDPRDQAIAAAIHACKHKGKDLFRDFWVRGSVPGFALLTYQPLGVYVSGYDGDADINVAASGSPSPKLKQFDR